MINSNKLKGRLREMNMTQKDVASCLDIALPTTSQKINNIRPMTLDEALKIADLLEIEDNQFRDFFLASVVA